MFDREECDECGHEDVLFNTILDGQAARLCDRCIKNSDAILIPIPMNVEVNIKRRTVDDVMYSMSGVKPGTTRNIPPIRSRRETAFPLRPVSFEGFKPKYREARDKQLSMLEEARKRVQEQKALELKRQQTETMQNFNAEELLEEVPTEPKKSSFKRFFNKIKIFGRKKERETKPQESEDLNNANQEL